MAESTQIRFSDDMIGDPNDLDDLIEATGRNLSDGSGDEQQEQRESGGEEERQGSGSDNDDENKKKDGKPDDPPKKKRKLAPRLNLNPERLKGPRGLTALLKEFETFKFKGKGREREDLERVLARMEHWAHRLQPKLHFEDFIAKAEKLCTKKKEMQVYMNRLRMGLETADDEILRLEDEEEEAPISAQNEALNEFDKLLDQQISHYDANYREPVRTPKTPATLPPSPAFVPIAASTLTAEQKELIARKKKEAMERRLARLRQLEEEHLGEATAASLATAAEENLNGDQSSKPAQVSNIQVPSNNTDVAAEQRERAARNKQLALEKLRARRLAAQGIQQPAPDLNISSSSDLAVPLSPSVSVASPEVSTSKPSPGKSPKRPEEGPGGSANQCHEILPLEVGQSLHSVSEKTDATDNAAALEKSQSQRNSPSTPENLVENDDNNASTKDIHQKDSAPASTEMGETDDNAISSMKDGV